MAKSIIVPGGTSVEIPDSDISVTSCSDVQEICTPLFRNTDIDYFHYGRSYADGSTVVLNCNYKWHQHVFKHALTPTTLRFQPGIYLVRH